MKPRSFQYHAPTTVAEAVDLLASLGDEAKVLAGGQSLIPLMSMRLAEYGHLVDLGRIEELRSVVAEDGAVRIGAMVRQAVAERDETVAQVPLVARALPHIGHFQIRNRGTVGGSIAHADPASELPAVALALDARIEAVAASGRRTVAAADFFEGTWQTSIADGELLASVTFPVWSGRSGFAVEELARRHGDFALVGTAVAVEVTDESVTRAAVTMFGVGATPVRCHAAEQALLAGEPVADAARVAGDEIDPSGDIHASGEYRRHVAPTLVSRALTRALQEARS